MANDGKNHAGYALGRRDRVRGDEYERDQSKSAGGTLPKGVEGYSLTGRKKTR